MHQFSEATSGKNCVYGRNSNSKEPNVNKKKRLARIPSHPSMVYLPTYLVNVGLGKYTIHGSYEDDLSFPEVNFSNAPMSFNQVDHSAP